MAASKTILFVTTNEYKIQEANSVFSDTNIAIEPVKLSLVEPQDTDQHVISLFKANQAYELTKKPVMVDDAGVFIASLNGFPGTLTSHVVKLIGIQGIFKLIAENEPAVFRASVSYKDESSLVTSTGELRGTIKKLPLSDSMLLSDVFFPLGETESLTVLSRRGYGSHRRIALEKLHERLAEGCLV